VSIAATIVVANTKMAKRHPSEEVAAAEVVVATKTTITQTRTECKLRALTLSTRTVPDISRTRMAPLTVVVEVAAAEAVVAEASQIMRTHAQPDALRTSTPTKRLSNAPRSKWTLSMSGRPTIARTSKYLL